MDHNVAAAARHDTEQEQGAVDACSRAAMKAGHSPDNAEQCESGDLECPTCPWR